MNKVNWFKEPLLHFLVLGAIIFAVYTQMNPSGPGEDEIVITRGQKEHLISVFTRTWNRPPTPPEFQGLLRDWIREEIAYRKGLEMGLDVSDTIIRRRLRQKLELLTEDIVTLSPPTTEDLEAWRAANESAYTVEPAYTLRQIYFSLDRRGEEAMRDAEQALLMLHTDGGMLVPEQMGDPTSLPERVVNERASALSATFGQVFTEAVASLSPGTWTGPVRSSFGIHLVLLEDRQPGRPLSLAEAEDDVRRDWENARRTDAIDRLYEHLSEGYTITIEGFEDEGTAQ